MTVPPAVIVAARWLLAVAAPAVALGSTLLLRPLLEQAPSPPFIGAVVVVAWLGGFAPSLLATVLSTLALDYYFLAPVGGWSTSLGDGVWLGLFVVISIVTYPSRRAVTA